jgi:proteasome assembly chaperone 2
MFRFFFLFKPTLSVGKVGGLAVDLLVSTYDAPRVGWLEDENVLPVVSNDALARLPRAEALLSTNLEVFQDADNKVTYVQQRAPVIQNHNALFVKSLLQWIRESKFSEVVLLTSVDSARRIVPAQFYDPQTVVGRYVASGGARPKGDQFGWPLLEEGDFDSAFKKTSFTHMMSEACKKEGITVSLLAIFCAEGINIPHAFAMADGLFHYLAMSPPRDSSQKPSDDGKHAPPRWHPPTSWHHLLGVSSSYDATLFG